MATDLAMSPQLEQIHGEIHDHFRALAYVSLLLLQFTNSKLLMTNELPICFVKQ